MLSFTSILRCFSFYIAVNFSYTSVQSAVFAAFLLFIGASSYHLEGGYLYISGEFAFVVP